MEQYVHILSVGTHLYILDNILCMHLQKYALSGYKYISFNVMKY